MAQPPTGSVPVQEPVQQHGKLQVASIDPIGLFSQANIKKVIDGILCHPNMSHKQKTGCKLWSEPIFINDYVRITIDVPEATRHELDLDIKDNKITFLSHHLAYAARTGLNIRNEASHLCLRRNCIEPEHIVDETDQAKRDRIKCSGYQRVCGKCKEVQSSSDCMHQPQCIRVVSVSECNNPACEDYLPPGPDSRRSRYSQYSHLEGFDKLLADGPLDQASSDDEDEEVSTVVRLSSLEQANIDVSQVPAYAIINVDESGAIYSSGLVAHEPADDADIATTIPHLPKDLVIPVPKDLVIPAEILDSLDPGQQTDVTINGYAVTVIRLSSTSDFVLLCKYLKDST